MKSKTNEMTNASTKIDDENHNDVIDQKETIVEKMDPKFINQYSDIPEDPEELERYLSEKVKIRWSRVLIVASVIGFILIVLNLLVVWIISFYIPLIFLSLPFFFFIEVGVLFIWGSCLGITKQSFTIDRIRRRMVKGEPITGADTKIAIGSAYTYILAGIILAVASFISWIMVSR